MDRPTGNYTHERLIALEDSHKSLLLWIEREVVWLRHIRHEAKDNAHVQLGFDQADSSALLLVERAKKIREEAGL